MPLVLTVVAVFLILLASEIWWRRRHVHGEFSRKFVHITVGSFVAFWPFYLEWGEIQALSLAFLVVVIISKQLGLFRAIHSVQRPTWGEVFFAAAVGLITLITQNEWIYAAALLQMSLADGVAAVVGVRFGNRLKYLVFGHAKSVVGTLAFFVVSVAILAVTSQWAGVELRPGYILAISAIASLVENLAVKGFDNLLVPVIVALLLISH